jgi:DNA polymerase-1
MEEGRRIRRAFTAGDEKHLIVSADYSQIDLRSLAHISGDENLIYTFIRALIFTAVPLPRFSMYHWRR